MFRRIGQKMVKVIQDYAPKNGYSVVMGSDQLQVLFASTEVDLTEQIVKLYDAAYPVDASTSSGPATPATRSGTPSTAKPSAPKPKP
jgi:hypothetical protein